MVDPATVSNWGLMILKWAKEPPIISGLLKPRSRYHDVSIVPQRMMYGEAKQDTHIAVDCLVTNGSQDRSLIIARSECYVRGYGTVHGIVVADAIPTETFSGDTFYLRIFHRFGEVTSMPVDLVRSIWKKA